MTDASSPSSPGARVAERLLAADARLGAFVCLDPAGFDALDTATGPLAGVAVGVKDVLDVAGLPTRNGSDSCAGAPPAAADAAVVARLRQAGAAILGKTVTTEFAFTDPAPTLNPLDETCTPGGSSSGSGAAVGAGLVDIAVGTQTAGSLLRPAAYCGAVAFKPGLGVLPTTGMTPLAPSFDTVGFIARSPALAAAAFTACTGQAPDDRGPAGLRLALGPVDSAAPVSPEAARALTGAGRAARGAGATVEPERPPVNLTGVVADHRIVMLHEAAAAHGDRLAEPERLRPNIRTALREGRTILPTEAAAARRRLAAARAAFWAAFEGYDALLSLPVPAAAPPREGGTGFQHMLTPWTVFGGPLLCLPWGRDARGLPLSVMVAARPGAEALVLGLGAALAALAP